MKRIEIYRARNGQFAWRLRAANGRVLCDGAETYRGLTGLCRGLAGTFGFESRSLKERLALSCGMVMAEISWPQPKPRQKGGRHE